MINLNEVKNYLEKKYWAKFGDKFISCDDEDFYIDTPAAAAESLIQGMYHTLPSSWHHEIFNITDANAVKQLDAWFDYDSENYKKLMH